MPEHFGVGREVERRSPQILFFPDDIPQDFADADNPQRPLPLALNVSKTAGYPAPPSSTLKLPPTSTATAKGDKRTSSFRLRTSFFLPHAALPLFASHDTFMPRLSAMLPIHEVRAASKPA